MSASRSRGIGASAVALLLALVASFAAGVGVNTAWARHTLLDTDNFIATISQPLLADPDVKDALARDLAQQAFGQLDLGAGLPDSVPFELRVMASQLGDQVIAELKARLRPAIRDQLDSALVDDVWDQASRELHRQLVDEISTGASASVIDVDLRPVLVQAIAEVGVAVQHSFPNLPFITPVFSGMANALPDDTGTVPIDISDIQGPTRFAIAHATEIEAGAVIVGTVALGLALLSRRRGLTVLVFGAGVLGMAALTYGVFALSFGDAGAKVAAHATTPISADVQQIIAAQAALIVASYRPWAGVLAVAGLVLVLVGAVWTARSRGHGGGGGLPGTSDPAAVAPTPLTAAGWTMPDAPPVR
jgi:hypothetical protein